MRGLLVKIIIYSSALLPLSFAHWLGSMLGKLLYRIPNRHRHIARINIARCYPHLGAHEQAALLHTTLIELGKSIFEIGALWRWPRHKVLGLIKKISGEQYLDEALKKNNGVILALPHLGAWEIIGMYGSARHKMTSLYQPPAIEAIDSLMRQSRERLGATLVPTDTSGVRSLYQALKHNHIVAILPDQDPGDSGNVFAPFFGIQTNTMTLITRIAQKTEAEVLFCFAERLPKGKGFHIHLLPAPTAIFDDDPVGAATAINKGIEQCIAYCPDQYQWCYKRFKKRPEGETGFY